MAQNADAIAEEKEKEIAVSILKDLRRFQVSFNNGYWGREKEECGTRFPCPGTRAGFSSWD